jgi:hypothetical protein
VLFRFSPARRGESAKKIMGIKVKVTHVKGVKLPDTQNATLADW